MKLSFNPKELSSGCGPIAKRLGLGIGFLAATCFPLFAQSGPTYYNPNRQLAYSMQNSTGTISVSVWQATSPTTEHCTVTCDVDPDYVLVGGGAWAVFANQPNVYGALLTASCPEPSTISSLTTWLAESKDQKLACSHTLNCYAIGLKLQGVDRSTLLSYMTTRQAVSNSADYPTTQATVPNGFQLIGGGAYVNYGSGYGNLLTASYPLNTSSWNVSSKDQLVADSCTITAYAIGITTGTIPGFGTLTTHAIAGNAVYASSGEGTAFQTIPSGEFLTCVGGKATWSGTGRMLFQMYPDFSAGNVTIGSKDHMIYDSGVTTSYMVTVTSNQ